jgi:hypothetical protein
MLARLGAAADANPAPLFSATVRRAHLYGFVSPDSDFNLRGVHLRPLTTSTAASSRDSPPGSKPPPRAPFPMAPAAGAALHDLLVRPRLG